MLSTRPALQEVKQQFEQLQSAYSAKKNLKDVFYSDLWSKILKANVDHSFLNNIAAFLLPLIPKQYDKTYSLPTAKILALLGRPNLFVQHIGISAAIRVIKETPDAAANKVGTKIILAREVLIQLSDFPKHQRYFNYLIQLLNTDVLDSNKQPLELYTSLLNKKNLSEQQALARAMLKNANLVAWLIKENGLDKVINYLDDGKPFSLRHVFEHAVTNADIPLQKALLKNSGLFAALFKHETSFLVNTLSKWTLADFDQLLAASPTHSPEIYWLLGMQRNLMIQFKKLTPLQLTQAKFTHLIDLVTLLKKLDLTQLTVDQIRALPTITRIYLVMHLEKLSPKDEEKWDPLNVIAADKLAALTDDFTDNQIEFIARKYASESNLCLLMQKNPEAVIRCLENLLLWRKEDKNTALTSQAARTLLHELDQGILKNLTLDEDQINRLVVLGIYKVAKEDSGLLTDERIQHNKLIKADIIRCWKNQRDGFVTKAVATLWAKIKGNQPPYLDHANENAFYFILTNEDLLLEILRIGIDQQSKELFKAGIQAAAKKLTLEQYLKVISLVQQDKNALAPNVTDLKNILINSIPDFLENTPLIPTHLDKLKRLDALYLALHPLEEENNAEEKINTDTVLAALEKNASPKEKKYATIGPIIFSHPLRLSLFLKRAENYQIPGILDQLFPDGFLFGAFLGALAMGVFTFFKDVLHIINPLNWFDSDSFWSRLASVGSTVIGGVAAKLIGFGMGTTLAAFIAPILVGALVGGIAGATVCVIVKKVKQLVNWIFSEPDMHEQNHMILQSGLKDIPVTTLQRRLFSDITLQENMAKMLIQQEANGFRLRFLPDDIRAVIEPIKEKYYWENQNFVVRALGNIVSGISLLLTATFFVVTLSLLSIPVFTGSLLAGRSFDKQRELAEEELAKPDTDKQPGRNLGYISSELGTVPQKSDATNKQGDQPVAPTSASDRPATPTLAPSESPRFR